MTVSKNILTTVSPHDHISDWEIGLTAAAQTSISSPGKDQNTKFKT